MKWFRIRLTGISTPCGGMSWEFKETEAEIAKRLVTFVEGRRVVAGPHSGRAAAWHAQESVLTIRERITLDLEKLDQKSELYQKFRLLRDACNEFLYRLEEDSSIKNKQNSIIALRKAFATNILEIAKSYRFIIEYKKDIGRNEEDWCDFFKDQYPDNMDVRLQVEP